MLTLKTARQSSYLFPFNYFVHLILIVFVIVFRLVYFSSIVLTSSAYVLIFLLIIITFFIKSLIVKLSFSDISIYKYLYIYLFISAFEVVLNLLFIY